MTDSIAAAPAKKITQEKYGEAEAYLTEADSNELSKFITVGSFFAWLKLPPLPLSCHLTFGE